MMNWKGFGRIRRDILEVLFRNVRGGTKESHVRSVTIPSAAHLRDTNLDGYCYSRLFGDKKIDVWS
jgi:hypothetical protein